VASQEYATVPQKAELECLTVLRRVASFVCSQETGDWSFASLSAALDIPEEKLRKEFGTEEALLEASGEMLLEVVVTALTDRLRTARTGREGVLGMLEIAIALRRGYRKLKRQRAGVRFLALERKLDPQGELLDCQIRDRFERAVYEGELPEGANVHSLSALTLAVVSGLLFGAPEEVSDVTLLDSARLFVEGLGFHVVRSTKSRPRRLAPVLQFVRRSAM
jgi:AcrR family transcriptional regulator